MKTKTNGYTTLVSEHAPHNRDGSGLLGLLTVVCALMGTALIMTGDGEFMVGGAAAIFFALLALVALVDEVSA